ncbi:glycosyltransferase involved in cell wall biosynthesis [Halanaerobacter jeridensis]|uniref:Glycosyltransferase involved in cell wall biosynthesis n=2 Tax=Halanaerobacter jeridensis TaxID=706427 RepID=A0A939BQA9_9FIRM|nr:glycosyltransferase family 1 protein [Halanaerobacter jeridensis]MBM7558082.1 glycosyltransferase involved in cell wall biosynthesis [Halanaerobacter jeridensis]
MNDWTGLGKYSKNLIKEFNNIQSIDDLYLLSNKKTEDNRFDLNNIKCESDVFSIKEQLELPFITYNNQIDLFHSPHFVFPVFNFNKIVLTIHDITPLLFSEDYSKMAIMYMKSMIWLAKFRANKVITVSKNTKQDLIDKFNFKEEKIKVTHIAIDDFYEQIDDVQALNTIKNKYNTGEEYLLYVGNIKPYKNISRLLKALAKVKKYNKDIKLIIVGKRDDGYDEVFDIMEEHNLEDNVSFTGFVSNEDLLLLYNAATAFVFPSLYEGFGLPPVEAMACGTPVVATNTSAVPEVVDDAAVKFNPYDVNEMAKSIIDVLDNKKLQQKLSKNGLKRAEKFSWKKTAKETLEVYKEVLNK